MRILNRYIRNSVIGSTAIVLFVLLGLESFMEFVSQLSDVGISHYSVYKAFVYSLTQLPSVLYQLFPMAGFLGCLIGLGRLASSSQLVVMRSAGISVGRITWSIIKAALIMLVVVTFVGELIAPKLGAKGETMKTMSLSHQVGFKALGGVWLRNATSYIHIGSIEARNKVGDVTRFVINAQHVQN